jgi:membrane fusion protein (multidrug efflux system)
VQLPVADDVLVIPLTAVLSAPYGDTVYVVEAGTNAAAGLVVRSQLIRTGPARGDYVSVEAGLKAGEKVISTGVFKMHSGDPVKEDNTLTPPTSQTPQPNNS